ncbi:unnamed protein product [Moneuplotes crassus]|uniref:Uncharacterized protein n=2 Tax=Euplotes crassus TaxID=5936 RepID=A0AAD2D892_EUPCR|nr:unnamed protein product [Moneuplotes crassus]
MKAVLLLFCIFIASTMAYHNLEHHNSTDILDKIQERDGQVYVLMFYSPGHQGGTHNAKTVEDERELIERVLKKHPSFHYAKINAADPNYKDLIETCGIVTTELHESPSVLIIEGGTGVWIHGPQTVNKIEEFAEEFLKRSRTSH